MTTTATRSTDCPPVGTQIELVMRALVSFEMAISSRQVSAVTRLRVQTSITSLASLHSAYPHLARRIRSGMYQATPQARALYEPLEDEDALAYVQAYEAEHAQKGYVYAASTANKRRKTRLAFAGHEVFAVPTERHLCPGWGLEVDGVLIRDPNGSPTWWPGREEAERGARRLLARRQTANNPRVFRAKARRSQGGAS